MKAHAAVTFGGEIVDILAAGKKDYTFQAQERPGPGVLHQGGQDGAEEDLLRKRPGKVLPCAKVPAISCTTFFVPGSGAWSTTGAGAAAGWWRPTTRYTSGGTSEDGSNDCFLSNEKRHFLRMKIKYTVIVK